MNKMFEYKRRYKTSDGTELIDMCIPAYKTDEIRTESVSTLVEEHSGRIDKFTYYNCLQDLDNIDTVMYANHIFNPFAIKEGDILYMSSISDLYYVKLEPKLIDGTTYAENSSDDEPKTYAENVEYMARMGLGLK